MVYPWRGQFTQYLICADGCWLCHWIENRKLTCFRYVQNAHFKLENMGFGNCTSRCIFTLGLRVSSQIWGQKNIVKMCLESSQRELSHGRVKMYKKGYPSTIQPPDRGEYLHLSASAFCYFQHSNLKWLFLWKSNNTASWKWLPAWTNYTFVCCSIPTRGSECDVTKHLK